MRRVCSVNKECSNDAQKRLMDIAVAIDVRSYIRGYPKSGTERTQNLIKPGISCNDNAQACFFNLAVA